MTKNTRVLPLKKLSDDIYQLRFSNPLSINPDTLVALSQSRTEIKRPFVLKVRGCLMGEVVYSFAILENGKRSIIPCKGRRLPTDCYLVEFELEQEKATKGFLFITILSALGITILFLFFYSKSRKGIGSESHIKIGNFLFDQKMTVLF